MVRLSTFTKLTRDYSPLVDTVDAIMKTETGITGSFSVSFGSSTSGSEYTVTGENGYVSVRGITGTGGGALVGSMSSWVVSQMIGEERKEKEFANDGTGVHQEAAAWAQPLSCGKGLNERQTPENALIDIELVSKRTGFPTRLLRNNSNNYGLILRRCYVVERMMASQW
jgi:predicted dehydrogenase